MCTTVHPTVTGVPEWHHRRGPRTGSPIWRPRWRESTGVENVHPRPARPDVAAVGVTVVECFPHRATCGFALLPASGAGPATVAAPSLPSGLVHRGCRIGTPVPACLAGLSARLHD